MVAVTSMLNGSLTGILLLGRAPQVTVALSVSSSSLIPTDVKWESVPVMTAWFAATSTATAAFASGSGCPPPSLTVTMLGVVTW
jgi:hypothetical protein